MFGKTLAFIAPLALKLGVTRRVLLTLIGVAVAMIVVLVLLVVGLLGSFGGGWVWTRKSSASR